MFERSILDKKNSVKYHPKSFSGLIQCLDELYLKSTYTGKLRTRLAMVPLFLEYFCLIIF
jgi:hypothetical protein